MATAQATTPPLPLGAVRAVRHPLADGAATTVHVAVYERSRVALRVAAMEAPEPLAGWCARSGVRDALVGGFFVTPHGTSLGELWIGGARRASVPFDPPWGAGRSGLAVDGGRIRIDERPRLPARPAGDLLQAGPLLVRGGRAVVRDGDDPEGFSAGRAQFDSDIADGRHPRAALGVSEAALIAVACDGRAGRPGRPAIRTRPPSTARQERPAPHGGSKGTLARRVPPIHSSPRGVPSGVMKKPPTSASRTPARAHQPASGSGASIATTRSATRERS